MVKPIVRDVIFLAQKSLAAVPEDFQTGVDLLETLKAHEEECVGMAANMIGVKKRIIVFIDEDGHFHLMFNPKIVRQSVSYEAVEGCLSLNGARTVTRYKNIKVQWQNRDFKHRAKTFTGRTAQIIQHEIDHCNGILI